MDFSNGLTITGGLTTDQTVTFQPLYSWGDNSDGAAGLNSTINHSSPVQIGSNLDWRWKQISAGGTSIDSISGGVKTDGTLWMWGSGVGGALGLSDTISRSSPTQVGSSTDWSKLTIGQYNILALKTNGTIWGWGTNTGGQLGLNDTIRRSSPVQIGTDNDWNIISAGNQKAFFIKNNGTLWGTGRNFAGGLGINIGASAYRSSPVQIGTATDWASVSAQAAGVGGIAVKTNNTLWTWGQNTFGTLGLNDTISRSSPTQVGGLTNWLIASSTYAVLALKTNGGIWAWGQNNNGQLGLGNTIDRSSPVQVGASTDWDNIVMSRNNLIATKVNGTLWITGSGSTGTLGFNDTISRSSPTQVGSDTSWNFVESSWGTVLATKSTQF